MLHPWQEDGRPRGLANNRWRIVKKALLLLSLVAVLLCMLTVSAQAHYPAKPEPYKTMTMEEKHHHFHVIKGHAWAHTKHPMNYRDLVWHRQANRQIKIQLAEVHAALRLQKLRSQLPPIDGCLYEIILREGSGFRRDDPSTWYPAAKVWNGRGSRAYGIPQALPGYKMASAGPDWKTNPITQIRWMIGYVNGRYGGSCAALAHHDNAGYY